jgi:hypothetical protein
MKRRETSQSNEGISIKSRTPSRKEKPIIMNIKTARKLAGSRDVNHRRDAHNGRNSMMSTTAGPYS